MITQFDQFKTFAGNWVIIVRTTRDNQQYASGPYIWYETDGGGEAHLKAIVKRAMR